MKLLIQAASTFFTIFPSFLISFQYHQYNSFMPWPKCNSRDAFKTPKSLHELKQLVQEAGSQYKTLKPVGSLHSASEIICTEGTPIDMKHFNHIQLNEDSNSVTVGCGATLNDVAKRLHNRGRTLAHLPTLGLLTVCGAIGTGAHGSSLKHPTALSDQIVSMRVMDGLGKIRIIRGKALDAFRIHLGLLGILIEVELQTVESFKLEFSRKLESDRILTSGEAIKLARNSEYLQLYWFPFQEKVAVVRGLQKDKETEGIAFTDFYPESYASQTARFREALETLQEKRHFRALQAIEENTLLSLTELVLNSPPVLTENGVTMKNPAVGWNFNVTMDSCDKCSWSHGNDSSLLIEDASFGCDLSNFSDIVGMIKEVKSRLPFQLPVSGGGINLRFHKDSTALMSMAYKRPNGVVIVEMITPTRTDFLNKPRAGLAAVQAISQALVYRFGCRPHWGKNGKAFKTAKLLRSVIHPGALHAFKKAMKKYDPLGVFRNAFAAQLLAENYHKEEDHYEPHCALQDNCFCKKDQDCAEPEQICDTFTFLYPVDDSLPKAYRVCKDKQTYKNRPLGPYNPYNLSDIFRAANV